MYYRQPFIQLSLTWQQCRWRRVQRPPWCKTGRHSWTSSLRSLSLSLLLANSILLPGSNVGGEEHSGLLGAELVVDGHTSQLVQAPVQRHYGHPWPQSNEKWFPVVVVLTCNHCSNWTWVVEEILAFGTRLRSTHCREFNYLKLCRPAYLLLNYNLTLAMSS